MWVEYFQVYINIQRKSSKLSIEFENCLALSRTVHIRREVSAEAWVSFSLSPRISSFRSRYFKTSLRNFLNFLNFCNDHILKLPARPESGSILSFGLLLGGEKKLAQPFLSPKLLVHVRYIWVLSSWEEAQQVFLARMAIAWLRALPLQKKKPLRWSRVLLQYFFAARLRSWLGNILITTFRKLSLTWMMKSRNTRVFTKLLNGNEDSQAL